MHCTEYVSGVCVRDRVTPVGMRKQVAVRCGEISLPLPWEQGNTSNPHSGLLLTPPSPPPLLIDHPSPPCPPQPGVPTHFLFPCPSSSSPFLPRSFCINIFVPLFPHLSSLFLILLRCFPLSPAHPSSTFSFLLLFFPCALSLRNTSFILAHTHTHTQKQQLLH